MKRRLNLKQIRIRGGILNREGFPKWEPTYAREHGRGDGDEYQVFAVDAAGGAVWAGVSRHTHINQAIANQIQRVWERTRIDYNRVGGGSLDLSTEIGAVTRLVIFPIDRPAERLDFQITQKL